eukprot:NODE_34775_length_182_cov_1.503759_g33605_i0.p2 GENE.NODE_34775_length_182_cov_1.503759_g33605_i0~~NODE_34775_length_182_cov_1.503759_g33605_i0.p2  ORF type:complete len:58 (-),score=14.98 NODE_34775_length_182_cov_1.503759_g33605_i0:9-182(-)
MSMIKQSKPSNGISSVPSSAGSSTASSPPGSPDTGAASPESLEKLLDQATSRARAVA